jgi:hypothetical protein
VGHSHLIVDTITIHHGIVMHAVNIGPFLFAALLLERRLLLLLLLLPSVALSLCLNCLDLCQMFVSPFYSCHLLLIILPFFTKISTQNPPISTS